MARVLNLDLDGINDAKSNFESKYTSVNLHFAQDIKINWINFIETIESSISWRINETILRFIHRYDQGEWFLTVECCHVSRNGIIDILGSRFDLKNGKIKFESNFKEHFDQNYFNNVKYNGTPLIRGKHVNYVSMPWVQEIKEGANINNINNLPDANIVFTSCSFDYSGELESVRVRWPHTIAFYFSSDIKGDLLDNLQYQSNGALVPFKAYDYANPCPNNCSDIYEWPYFFDATNPYKQNYTKSVIVPSCPAFSIHNSILYKYRKVN